MKKIKIYLVIVMSLLIGFFMLNFVSGYFGDRVEVYVHKKAALYATVTIENALRESVIDNIDEDKLLNINYDSNNVVKSVIINTAEVNRILADVNRSVVDSLEEIKEENLDLPLGIILSETLLGDVGPTISIRIIPATSATTDIISEVSPYGINSSLFELSIKVKVDIETIIPLRRNISSLNFNIPIVITVLNSDVPQIYLMNKG